MTAKETVSVPEWGGEVVVQAMTGPERDGFERSIYHDGIKDFVNVREKLCVRSIVNGRGEKVFSLSDIVSLGKKSDKALDRVFGVAKRLSGIGKKEIMALKRKLEAAPLRLFEFQLAAKLGCTRKELLKRVDSKELSEWYAYNLIDPFTEDRADKRSAIIARVAATGLLHNSFSTNEFRAVPKEVKQMSLKTMSEILRGWASQT